MILPLTCPRCNNAMAEDGQFKADMAEYQIPRTRMHCAAGHTTYIGERPPPIVLKRPVPVRRELKQRPCDACGHPYTPLVNGSMYCPEPECKAEGRRRHYQALRAARVSTRNKSGWQKLSEASLTVVRRTGTSIRKPKEDPRPYVDPDEEEVA